MKILVVIFFAILMLLRLGLGVGLFFSISWMASGLSALFVITGCAFASFSLQGDGKKTCRDLCLFMSNITTMISGTATLILLLLDCRVGLVYIVILFLSSFYFWNGVLHSNKFPPNTS